MLVSPSLRQHGLCPLLLLGRALAGSPLRAVSGHLRFLFGRELGLFDGRIGQRDAVDFLLEGLELVLDFVFVLVRHFVRKQLADFLVPMSAENAVVMAT